MHILTIIKIAHLLGLIMGLGGALLLDFSLVTRAIIRPISAYTLHHAEVMSRIVTAGLAILWLTGFGLIFVNLADKPDYLNNPKLWAKIIIVLILTINGWYIHNSILPFVKSRLGYRLLFKIRRATVARFCFVASISFMSWTIPFILGKASELNFVTPMWLILSVYAGCVIGLWGIMFLIMIGLLRIQRFALWFAAGTARENSVWEDWK